MSIHQNKHCKLFWFFVISLCSTLVLSYLVITQGYIFLVTHPGCRTPQVLPSEPPGKSLLLLSADGAKVPAYYYPSRNQAAIIALGGLDGALGDNNPPVSYLIQAGYGVIQIGSRNCSAPPGPVTLGYHELNDAKAALEFLEKQAEVHPDKIGIFGFSMGAATAIRLVSQSDNLGAAIAEGSYFNLGQDILDSDRSPSALQKIFLNGIYWAYRFQIGVDPHLLSPVDDLPQTNRTPIFLIFGEREIQATRAEQQIAAGGANIATWIVPGGGHGANYHAAREDYEAKVLAFFTRYLDPVP